VRRSPVVGLNGVGIILDVGPGGPEERTMYVFLPHDRYSGVSRAGPYIPPTSPVESL
jgi:hypothetical protein